MTSVDEKFIKNMSQKDYMNDIQKHFFHDKLLNLKNDCTKKIKNYQKEIHVANFPETIENASIESEKIVTLRLIDRETKLLHKIEKSLCQINEVSSTYGFCKNTGKPIGIDRLLARPTAELAIEEKVIEEAEEKRFSKESRQVTEEDK
ncbi:RNA polymerase-binding protein DksA [Gammaproteobacteria bacterium]|jgi:DnaK suppressor protein|nr:RNA polymerase-binding protein DksA [Gammaproteobacteria bacterium]